MFFPRSAQADLTRWYESKGRKPLVIRGARQVGKSTLVRQFAEATQLELIEVNLERHADLENVFQSMKVEPVLREIGVIVRRDPATVTRPLIFLDEIQAAPQALRWLRYVYEERPELPVIAAGSLLEFALKDAAYSMPVGRIDFLWLRPMSFSEYLTARGDNFLSAILENTVVTSLREFSTTAHHNLLQRQREFLMVGGMPAAVKSYIEEGVLAARETQEGIIRSYLDDMAKYARRHPLSRLQRIFRAVPGVLGTRVKYVNLSRSDNHRDIKEVLELLTMAGVVIPIFHSDCSGVPLSAGEDASAFKLLFLDVGLASRTLGLDWNEEFRIDETRLINDGGLAEQFIGQDLVASTSSREESRLHFWRREKAQSHAEIDYVFAIGRHIIPIEVKAGATGTLRSLHQFVLAKQPPLAIRYDASTPSQFMIDHDIIGPNGPRAIHYPLLSLPLYFAGQGLRLAKNMLSAE